MKSQHTAIIVCGPTAVGKTAVAVELAAALSTEIINADSRQIYRELNIGVAKPSPEELARVKHHLVGTHSVGELYGAGDFEDEALQVIENIFSQHTSAILCGGTGMYLKAFCEGLDELPTADEVYRQFLHEQFSAKGIAFLQEELRTKDAVALERIDIENPQRLMRALEVIQATGKLYSTILTGQKAQRAFNVLKIGLNMDRELLYQRINQRVDEMMQAGLLEEAKAFYPQRHLNALKTVGYNELFAHFDGTWSLQEAVNKIKQHTRNYAKRQLTWFRGDAQINWFTPEQLPQIIDFVKAKTFNPQSTI